MNLELLPNRVNFLFSHHYLLKSQHFRDVVTQLSEEGYINLLVDSGAFSAYFIGAEIKIDDYNKDCKKYYHGRCHQYMALDVLYNPEASEANLKKSYDMGLTPTPILVHGQDPSKCAEYIELSPYLAIPGRGGEEYCIQRFQQAYKASGNKAKIHGLAHVKYPLNLQLPLNSCDSSTYLAGQQFGRYSIFKSGKGFDTYVTADIKQPKASLIPKDLARLWTRSGMDPKERLNDSLYRGSFNWGGLATMSGYLDFHDHMAHMKPSYFFATSDLLFMSAILAVKRTKRKHGHFKYREARDTIETMKGILRDKNVKKSVAAFKKLIED